MQCALFQSIRLLLFVALYFGASTVLYADNWPSRSVRILVGTAAGGTADTLARVIAQHFSKRFSQSFVVENRTGAGGLIALENVKSAPADGYTLVVSGGSQHTVLPVMMKDFPYDPINDLTHIGFLGGPPSVLVVNPNLKVRNLKDFLKLAKQRPGQLSYGSPGLGTQGHLTGELIKQSASINMVHVPYKGANPALVDLIAGHIDVGSVTLSSASSQIGAGTVVPLAITSVARSPAFPEVPTFKESGFDDVVSLAWFGLSGPANLPTPIVHRLNDELRQILRQEDVAQRLRTEGIDLTEDMSSEQFQSFVAEELKRWKSVVKHIGIQVDR